ncbi:unnamed protein product [Ilex paraguariensis]|uniref:histidine kinase n=1 Tax=Ilex paraguariensis TaxID=185542 RepID=A0ABC8RRC4_9AQUA
MKLSSLIVLRPVCFFIVLAFVVLLLPGLLIPFWITKVKRVEDEVKLISQNLHQNLQSEIENMATLLTSMNSSATNLRRVLSSSLDETELAFSQIETKVAPSLFQSLSTIPHLSQISYIGLDGLFFSYYTEGAQPFAVYSNSSFSTNPNATTNYAWYTQPVNRDTGKLYGGAVKSLPSVTFNASWFREALNSTSGYASLGTVWNNAQDLLFLNTVGMDGRGAISLGFTVKPLVEIFSGINYNGGSFYLATKDGKVLNEGIPNTRMILADNSVSFQLLKSSGDQIGQIGNVTCESNDGSSRASILNIWETKYIIYCSTLDIVGVQSVYALALPHKGLESLIHKNIQIAFVLLVLMICSMVLYIFIFVFLTVRAARREMYLCAALIKQMEATQQAERKSMNKILAFASASHDVRASLAGITGLIEICRDEVAHESELETNLIQMEACTKDLLGILNSILDTSKIEAGKMLLEEEEFDLARLLEDVVDLYYPVGLKKGVDVVLDPYDGSITKFCHLKGDRGKLKQILSNLLSNAVKFTSEGHVSVRAWAKKPSFENSLLASNRNNSLTCMSCLFSKNDKAYNGLEAMNTAQQDPNCMEFVFEVNDTGKGIPKEKRKSVFENYVQVTETALGQEGTGLGLGIVQSLVRLMGGEIGIVDKEDGEKGTCFRFNTFLTVCEAEVSGNAREDDTESHGGYISSDSYQHSGPTTRIHSPKLEGSHIILFIQSNERAKILHKYMENLGIKVSVVNQYEQLPRILKRTKQRMILSRYSSSGRSDMNSRSDCLSRPASRNSSTRSKEVPLSAMDGTDHTLSLQTRTQLRGTSNFILIVIDTSAGPFRELSMAVAEFRRDLCSTCNRVVWIAKAGARSINAQGLDEDKLPPTDLIISKPFHGSRLYQVIGLLPEFGGRMPATPPKIKGENTHMTPRLRRSPAENLSTHQGEIQELGGTSTNKPLSGKRVLVAEDSLMLRKVAMSRLSQLGASVILCENGEEALQLVCQGLSDQRRRGASHILPFDYILMDCQMNLMDGFEATRHIREEEEYYGVHIPIIALSAHSSTGEEASMMIQAGMDYCLSKPLNEEQLMEAITYIHSR